MCYAISINFYFFWQFLIYWDNDGFFCASNDSSGSFKFILSSDGFLNVEDVSTNLLVSANDNLYLVVAVPRALYEGEELPKVKIKWKSGYIEQCWGLGGSLGNACFHQKCGAQKSINPDLNFPVHQEVT